jgi:putative ABC transport system permease protein
MTLIEYLRMAWEALWTNRLRSFLALLGVVIGVFSVTTMISLGEIASAGIRRDLESLAGRSIFIQPNLWGGMNVKRLTDADVALLSRLPVEVIPQLYVSAQYAKTPTKRKTVTLVGTPGNLPALDPSARIARGRYFTAREGKAGLNVAVVNPVAAKELFGRQAALGRRAHLFAPNGGRIEVLIVGITEPLPVMFGGQQPQVSVPIPFLWRVHPDVERGKYDFLVLRVRQGYPIRQVERRVTRLIEQRYGKDVYDIDSAESFQEQLGTITRILQALLGAIGGLSLLVGGIGIMNIMLVSVTERTREIGLRKALGATARQIRGQFLIEAVLLTAVGGIVGVLLAAGVLWLIVAAVPFLDVFILSPLTIVLALTISILVGLFFGVMPAARAAALDPIDALRYE